MKAKSNAEIPHSHGSSSRRIMTASMQLLLAMILSASLGVTSVDAAVASTAPSDQIEFRSDEFWKQFHHGTVTVNGVRLHYVEGGQGTPILLIPGWPQSWYAWRLVMPALALAGHRVIAVDPRGMGDSAHPASGYDLKTVAKDIHEFVTALDLAKDKNLSVAGHDVGAWIGYAYAADWPGDVHKLALFEAALPGITPPAPAGTPSDAANVKTWHFAFNRLDDLPEVLVEGHERAYLTWIFQNKASKKWVFSPAVIDEYTRDFVQPGGSRAAFSYYRSMFSEDGLSANKDRSARKLSIPVLAIGGEYGVGKALAETAKTVSNAASGGAIEGCGHFILEECPAEVSSGLLNFFGRDR